MPPGVDTALGTISGQGKAGQHGKGETETSDASERLASAAVGGRGAARVGGVDGTV